MLRRWLFELAADGEDGIADGLGVELAAGLAGEEDVGGVFGSQFGL
jgi:hypothetical protein